MGLQEVEAPEFLDSRRVEVVTLSALRTVKVGQVIHIVKCVYDLMLLPWEETVLQGMSD